MQRETHQSAGLSVVFDDPQFARKYAVHMANKGRKIGRQFAGLLTRNGFDKGRILDVGCGAGDVAIEIARSLPGSRVTGVELSEPLLAMAESSARQSGLTDRLGWQKADVGSLPFADDSFDAVVCVYMLHHVEHPVAMLNEIERVLTLHGMFILEDVKRTWLAWFDRGFRGAFTWPEAKRVLESANLRPWRHRERFLGFRIWTRGA